MSTVTMWWEEGIAPVALEVVTTSERFRAIEQLRHQYGGHAFCEMCEVRGWQLLDRGFTYDGEDSGVIMCLQCLFDPTCIWGMLVRGDKREQFEDIDVKPGRHRA